MRTVVSILAHPAGAERQGQGGAVRTGRRGADRTARCGQDGAGRGGGGAGGAGGAGRGGRAGVRGRGTVVGVIPAATRHWVARMAQSISASSAILRSSSVVPPMAWRQATAAPASSATASFSAVA